MITKKQSFGKRDYGKAQAKRTEQKIQNRTECIEKRVEPQYLVGFAVLFLIFVSVFHNKAVFF